MAQRSPRSVAACKSLMVLRRSVGQPVAAASVSALISGSSDNPDSRLNYRLAVKEPVSGKDLVKIP